MERKCKLPFILTMVKGLGLGRTKRKRILNILLEVIGMEKTMQTAHIAGQYTGATIQEL